MVELKNFERRSPFIGQPIVYLIFKSPTLNNGKIKAVREVVFSQINGLGVIPMIGVLAKFGGFEILNSLNENTDLLVVCGRFRELQGITRVNSGNMHVALNLLASYGWLKETIQVTEAEATEESGRFKYQIHYRLTDEVCCPLHQVHQWANP